ncbi:uncharacterized protein RHOBADRAFT_42717 [Rhodotorula graminis WP1]|uniref:Zn(2)-C6 fungal-type domain-containing protein n=1 Tax=Rhodotorula graminis (strain WP1) TaxID=578459 RepID=A0A194SAF9_RHOGW|nr:uncharacterized protein RHOBADRAFT_42717 [Rhodotorula graminis WP1]KPV76386.1 hypothetical protein RHOBADRAFT_42717 [Rhodotorula graminis WP1]
MSSQRGYSPATSFGSISPGSASSSSSTDHDRDHNSTSNTASPGYNGQRRKNTRTASCDACIKSKRACDLLAPCRACEMRDFECTYSAVDPKARLGRLLAIEAADVERTIALRDLRNECDKLSLRVNELKTRLGLSDDELDALQQLANEQMLADKPRFDKQRLSGKAALMAAAAPTARRRTPLSTASTPPSPPPRFGSGALAATAASPSPSTQNAAPSRQSHKRGRSDEGASSVDEDGLERDDANSADEMPPPRTAPTRRQPPRASYRRTSLPRSTTAPAPPPARALAATNPPPLPPFDPSGRPYPAAAYHFPHTYPMPPQAPMPAPPAWMSPLLPTLYPVLPVPHGHRTWDTPRLERRGFSSPASASLGLGPGAMSGRGGGEPQLGRRWAGPALEGSQRGTTFDTGRTR